MTRTSDAELAIVTERAEARVWGDCVAAATPQVRAALGLVLEPFADGVSLIASRIRNVLYNRTFGFGLERPVTESHLDQAIARYRADAPFTIQPTPFVRPATVRAWLDHRGMVAYFNWVRWVRDTREAPPAATPFTIAPLAPGDDAGGFLETLTRVFEQPPQIVPWIACTIGRPGWTHYVARAANEIVAVGALRVDQGIGWLGWGGTLKAWRGRGAQSALIARRVADARAAGCRLVTVETAEDRPDRPNASYRNMARAGFRALYLRPSHVHPAPAPPSSE